MTRMTEIDGIETQVEVTTSIGDDGSECCATAISVDVVSNVVAPSSR